MRGARFAFVMALAVVLVLGTTTAALAAPAMRQNLPIELQTRRPLTTNALDLTSLKSGDILLMFSYRPGSVFYDGHSGMIDGTLFNATADSPSVWSANTRPVNGVQLEKPSMYRTSPYFGVRRPSWLTSGDLAACFTYYGAHLGNPYNLMSSKTDQTKWYCSKLPWYAIKNVVSATSKRDTDPNGGFWVTPGDLYNYKGAGYIWAQ